MLELSFLGWNFFSLLTFGLVGMFFSVPYRQATFSEYYARLREAAKEDLCHFSHRLDLGGEPPSDLRRRICEQGRAPRTDLRGGLLVFGLGGMAIVYFLAPLLDNVIRRFKMNILVPVCLVLLVVFG